MKMILVTNIAGYEEGVMVNQIIKVEQCLSTRDARTIWLANGTFIICNETLEEIQKRINEERIVQNGVVKYL